MSDIDPAVEDEVNHLLVALGVGGTAYEVHSHVDEDETEYLLSVRGEDRFYPILVTASDDPMEQPRWRHAADEELRWAVKQGVAVTEVPNHVGDFVQSVAPDVVEA